MTRWMRTSWWIVVLGVLSVAGITFEFFDGGRAPLVPVSTAAAPSRITLDARRETRRTLDPAKFVGKAARTHQVARDIPDVLDHLYCYCECDKHAGHKSLLSCYTDGHAAT